MSFQIASFDIGIKNFAVCVAMVTPVSHSLKITHLALYDLSKSDSPYHAMTQVLDSIGFNEVSVILVEKQMTTNKIAIRLAQHCLSYFLILYGRFKTIIEYPSQNKTRLLGASFAERKTKKGRKDFCVRKAIEILEEMSDEKSLEIVRKAKKKDDLCDVICMVVAYRVSFKVI